MKTTMNKLYKAAEPTRMLVAINVYMWNKTIQIGSAEEMYNNLTFSLSVGKMKFCIKL